MSLGVERSDFNSASANTHSVAHTAASARGAPSGGLVHTTAALGHAQGAAEADDGDWDWMKSASAAHSDVAESSAGHGGHAAYGGLGVADSAAADGDDGDGQDDGWPDANHTGDGWPEADAEGAAQGHEGQEGDGWPEAHGEADENAGWPVAKPGMVDADEDWRPAGDGQEGQDDEDGWPADGDNAAEAEGWPAGINHGQAAAHAEDGGWPDEVEGQAGVSAAGHSSVSWKEAQPGHQLAGPSQRPAKKARMDTSTVQQPKPLQHGQQIGQSGRLAVPSKGSDAKAKSVGRPDGQPAASRASAAKGSGGAAAAVANGAPATAIGQTAPPPGRTASSFLSDNLTLAGFGDPCAALYQTVRETVENGLDAGARRVDVALLPRDVAGHTADADADGGDTSAAAVAAAAAGAARSGPEPIIVAGRKRGRGAAPPAGCASGQGRTGARATAGVSRTVTARMTGTQPWTVQVEDDGCGLRTEDVPVLLGSVFGSSKAGHGRTATAAADHSPAWVGQAQAGSSTAFRSSFGTYGVGLKAAMLYAQRSRQPDDDGGAGGTEHGAGDDHGSGTTHDSDSAPRSFKACPLFIATATASAPVLTQMRIGIDTANGAVVTTDGSEVPKPGGGADPDAFDALEDETGPAAGADAMHGTMLRLTLDGPRALALATAVKGTTATGRGHGGRGRAGDPVAGTAMSAQPSQFGPGSAASLRLLLSYTGRLRALAIARGCCPRAGPLQQVTLATATRSAMDGASGPLHANTPAPAVVSLTLHGEAVAPFARLAAAVDGQFAAVLQDGQAQTATATITTEAAPVETTGSSASSHSGSGSCFITQHGALAALYGVHPSYVACGTAMVPLLAPSAGTPSCLQVPVVTATVHVVMTPVPQPAHALGSGGARHVGARAIVRAVPGARAGPRDRSVARGRDRGIAAVRQPQHALPSAASEETGPEAGSEAHRDTHGPVPDLPDPMATARRRNNRAGLVHVMRFARGIPLLRNSSSCAITAAVLGGVSGGGAGGAGARGARTTAHAGASAGTASSGGPSGMDWSSIGLELHPLSTVPASAFADRGPAADSGARPGKAAGAGAGRRAGAASGTVGSQDWPVEDGDGGAGASGGQAWDEDGFPLVSSSAEVTTGAPGQGHRDLGTTSGHSAGIAASKTKVAPLQPPLAPAVDIPGLRLPKAVLQQLRSHPAVPAPVSVGVTTTAAVPVATDGGGDGGEGTGAGADGTAEPASTTDTTTATTTATVDGWTAVGQPLDVDHDGSYIATSAYGHSSSGANGAGGAASASASGSSSLLPYVPFSCLRVLVDVSTGWQAVPSKQAVASGNVAAQGISNRAPSGLRPPALAFGDLTKTWLAGVKADGLGLHGAYDSNGTGLGQGAFTSHGTRTAGDDDASASMDPRAIGRAVTAALSQAMQQLSLQLPSQPLSPADEQQGQLGPEARSDASAGTGAGSSAAVGRMTCPSNNLNPWADVGLHGPLLFAPAAAVQRSLLVRVHAPVIAQELAAIAAMAGPSSALWQRLQALLDRAGEEEEGKQDGDEEVWPEVGSDTGFGHGSGHDHTHSDALAHESVDDLDRAASAAAVAAAATGATDAVDDFDRAAIQQDPFHLMVVPEEAAHGHGGMAGHGRPDVRPSVASAPTAWPAASTAPAGATATSMSTATATATAISTAIHYVTASERESFKISAAGALTARLQAFVARTLRIADAMRREDEEEADRVRGQTDAPAGAGPAGSAEPRLPRANGLMKASTRPADWRGPVDVTGPDGWPEPEAQGPVVQSGQRTLLEPPGVSAGTSAMGEDSGTGASGTGASGTVAAAGSGTGASVVDGVATAGSSGAGIGGTGSSLQQALARMRASRLKLAGGASGSGGYRAGGAAADGSAADAPQAASGEARHDADPAQLTGAVGNSNALVDADSGPGANVDADADNDADAADGGSGDHRVAAGAHDWNEVQAPEKSEATDDDWPASAPEGSGDAFAGQVDDGWPM